MNPTYTRAWLESLSPLDNLESARELYQGLYALNRATLDPAQRLELMQLYRGAVREASESLQGAFARVSFPMPIRLRRLASSLCQLHVEMAFGYKLGLQDLTKSWLMPWRRRHFQLAAAERALYHLSEVLQRAYQLYLPFPAGVWRDAHAIYRLAELHGRQDELIETQEGKGTVSVSISQRYRQMLLLGAAGPYQMPFGECATLLRFLSRWIDQAQVLPPAARAESSGCFLVDSTSDAPPAPLGRSKPNENDNALRLLDASELLRTLHVFLRRLEKGEPAANLPLGVDCLDSACRDMLQRLYRVYAQSATRRHSRIKRHETVMICAGIAALHFFASGQKSFARASEVAAATTSEDESVTIDLSPPTEMDTDEAYVALDDPTSKPGTTTSRPDPESFRVDRWQVRDVSPQGLLITQDDEPRVRFRVGDVLGIQRTSLPGHWSVGLVRWFRAQGEKGIEVGVELVAPDALPASVQPVGGEAVPALLLPAVDAVHRPASVLIERGAAQVGKDCFLTNGARATRRVRVLDSLERTNSVEQVIVGNVIA
jgi:hypothetical protein